ncbi:MAG: hypothetical protein GXY33_02830 [Phycisphaerae bacterium]|nr:hypothetical protein [Phycisphaerae bacterium]
MDTRYQPVDDGYRIVGSTSIFNRTLYGGHAQDDLPERYFTFAGDAPMVMGAITDWRKRPDCSDAKCGTFMAGVAATPGVRVPVFYYQGERDGDRYGQWFHESPGTISTYRNGWTEHQVRPFFQCFPRVEALIEVLPLQEHAGFLVRLKVSTDQHVHLAMGFGGVTDFLGRLEFPYVKARCFGPKDCEGNRVELGENRALICGPDGAAIESRMWIGASFPVEVSLGDPKLVDEGVGPFLSPDADPDPRSPMVRMSCPLMPGQTLDGFVVVLRNVEEQVLDRYLSSSDPAVEIKHAIWRKHEVIKIETPDRMLDLTVPSAVVALDACWHQNTFCHGAYAWHCPYMGWRNWYGPTAIGWHDRVAAAIRAHAATQVRPDEVNGPEHVVQTEGDYNHLENSHGYIPEIPDGRRGIFYNMQEVYVDHVLHYLERTGDLALAREVFPVIADVLDWEQRILDSDDDGLYENKLNTWISDAHSYNGAGCAQSSAYNYRANRTMALLAEMLGRDAAPFAARAEKICEAVFEKLWQADRGILAEYVDTLGHRLVHPSPELATIYHAIEAGLVDPFQAHTMLRFTHTDLRNERTGPRGGRLVWSSNWYPQNYSSCGLYTAENLHLAWACFQAGQPAQAWPILAAVADTHFMGDNPGMACHCLTPSGYADSAQDFTEIMSLHLRTIVEGLFGLRCDLLRRRIEIAPGFPDDWKHARLKVRDVELTYRRQGRTETLTVRSALAARRIIRLPLRATALESVRINGSSVEYRIEPGIGRSLLVVESDTTEELTLTVRHGGKRSPSLTSPRQVTRGNALAIKVARGRATELLDPTGCLHDQRIEADAVNASAASRPGHHTAFVRVQADRYDAWLPVDFEILDKRQARRKSPIGRFEPIDLADCFNVALAEIHDLDYCHPRPETFSIMTRGNGRFIWDWNQGGYQKVVIDDSTLRRCGGTFTTASGIPFLTAADGPNAACVSIWDNFPEQLTVPLSGKGTELAVLLIGVTNPMQAHVENARLDVRYADDAVEQVSLVNPVNFDDWLVAAVQRENETVYFSRTNHAIVQRIALDPAKPLASLTVRAVANEVVVGLLGLAIRRKK